MATERGRVEERGTNRILSAYLCETKTQVKEEGLAHQKQIVRALEDRLANMRGDLSLKIRDKTSTQYVIVKVTTYVSRARQRKE